MKNGAEKQKIGRGQPEIELSTLKMGKTERGIEIQQHERNKAFPDIVSEV